MLAPGKFCLHSKEERIFNNPFAPEKRGNHLSFFYHERDKHPLSNFLRIHHLAQSEGAMSDSANGLSPRLINFRILIHGIEVGCTGFVGFSLLGC